MASSTPTRLVGVPQPAIKKAQLLLFVLCSFGEVCCSVVLAACASGRLQCADPPCERDLGLFVLQYCFLTSVCSAIAVACDERGSNSKTQAYKQFDAQNAQLPRRYTRRASLASSPGSVPPPATCSTRHAHPTSPFDVRPTPPPPNTYTLSQCACACAATLFACALCNFFNCLTRSSKQPNFVE